jgi:predicted metal-binding membrane protein
MMASASLPLRRQRNLILASLAVLSAGSWTILIWQARSMSAQGMGLTMGMDAALFIGIWIAMMVAMMFPAAAPMILVFAQIQSGKRQQGRAAVPTWLFTATYLLVWSVVGLLAYGAAIVAERVGGNSSWFMSNGQRLAGVLLIAAGIYQLTPLKRACLAKCRSPLAFIMTSWHDGYAGTVRMGLTHGLYCLGCCWLLFAILFPLGMMNIAALAVITLLIFAEKSLPFGDRLAWAAGGALICYGFAVAFSPGLIPLQVQQHPMLGGM